MANYIVPPSLLEPYVPAGTELDLWNGHCYVSLVGFMFMKTQVMGIYIPWHRDFEEINLRFYVRRKHGDAWRRGVVFIKEIVPKAAISMVANTIYGENYVTRQMDHSWSQSPENTVVYAWKSRFDQHWKRLSVQHGEVPVPIPAETEAEFITEHYWGYAKNGPRKTMEYEVRHPRWLIYNVTNFKVEGPIEQEYGADFADILRRPADSVFLAEGSAVVIMKGQPFCVD